MNRNDFRELTRVRLKEARVLLENGCYDGAYYLCGYAVECALKACIAKQTRRYDFPDKKKVTESYIHDLQKLVTPAGLQVQLNNEMKSDVAFERNWALVVQWSEESRYQRRTEQEARNLYSAIADRQHGVLRCIKKYW